MVHEATLHIIDDIELVNIIDKKEGMEKTIYTVTTDEQTLRRYCSYVYLLHIPQTNFQK